MKVLVTGASGFIAQKLCDHLLADGMQVLGSVRSMSKTETLSPRIELIQIETINATTDWSQALVNVDVVIHLAARVHIMNETATDPLKAYLMTNTEGSKNLATQAQKAGIKRFIFLSTIGVNGDSTGNRSFTEKDEPAPHNMYSTSKKIAEDELNEIASVGKMEIVIIRAPLVYGHGNRGNFLALMKVILRGIPLPLANLQNLKSFLYVGNLADALVHCAKHPNAKGTYLVSDGEDISTPELIKRIAKKLGKPARLFPFPFFMLKFCAFITGKSLVLERLTNSLTVDSSKIRQELNWNPPYTMDQGLTETAN